MNPRRHSRMGSYFWMATGVGLVAVLLRERERLGAIWREPTASLYSAAGRILSTENGGPTEARRITIGRPPDEVYRAWRNLSDLPRFVPYLNAVREDPPGRVHCEAELPGGVEVAWDARITADREGSLLSWESDEASSVRTRGTIRLKAAPADRGTEVALEIAYGAGRAGELLAKASTVAMRETLRRFKQWVETGEVATVENQPSARLPERQRPELRDVAAPFFDGRREKSRRVDEALKVSFPASDPPAYGGRA